MTAPALGEAWSRAMACVTGWPFAKPVMRAMATALGLLLLAFVGRTAVAGAPDRGAAINSTATTAADTASTPQPQPTSPPSSFASAGADALLAHCPTGPATTATATGRAEHAGATRRLRASPGDPVVLNTSTAEDLERLPGIGPKRSLAILALRTRLGRFRVLEDLLKVKGIGRATLRRLRPLLRLEPPTTTPVAPETQR